MVTHIFGKPGSGKTSYGVLKVLEYVKLIADGSAPYRFVYTNIKVNHPLVIVIPFQFLGQYDLSDGLIIIDEATMHADSHDYKNFDHDLRDFMCDHRHYTTDPTRYRCDLIFITQAHSRIDKTIREVTEKVYYIKQSRLHKHFSKVIPLEYDFFIPVGKPDTSGEESNITEGYFIKSRLTLLFCKRFDRRPTYPYYDSWERRFLPPIPLNYRYEDKSSWNLDSKGHAIVPK